MNSVELGRALLMTFFAIAVCVPAAAQVRKPIQAPEGDLILVEGNTRIRVVRRVDAQVRTIHKAAQRTLVVIADYAVDGGQPDGRVDVTFTFHDVEGEWPLGERWEGRATLDDYSVAGEAGNPGVGLTTPSGLIQILSGPRSARDARAFRDPGAVVAMTFSGSGRHSGTRDSFDEAEARPAPGTSQPVRVGSVLQTPVKTVDVAPILPVQAQRAGVRGMVILELHIGADGSVTDAKVLRSIPLLDEAALAAARQWRYEPTLLNGVPVPTIVTASVPFK
jgi:TonB family protein